MKREMKFSIVDDHKIYRKSLKLTLLRLFPNSQVKESSNGKDFINSLNWAPDLIFMDIKMPEMDGIRATKLALQKNSNLKILGISMYDDDFSINKMKESGARGFIMKGGEQKKMQTAMLKVLNGELYFDK